MLLKDLFMYLPDEEYVAIIHKSICDGVYCVREVKDRKLMLLDCSVVKNGIELLIGKAGDVLAEDSILLRDVDYKENRLVSYMSIEVD